MRIEGANRMQLLILCLPALLLPVTAVNAETIIDSQKETD